MLYIIRDTRQRNIAASPDLPAQIWRSSFTYAPQRRRISKTATADRRHLFGSPGNNNNNDDDDDKTDNNPDNNNDSCAAIVGDFRVARLTPLQFDIFVS